MTVYQHPVNGHEKCLFSKYLHETLLYFRFLVPMFISTRHLTLMTLFWSACLFYFNDNWIAMSIVIFLQRVTDTWDGAIGRERNEGYIKWGYFVDHFLDWVFLCSIMGALYVHTLDVWCLFICFPISIHMVGFSLSTTVSDEPYLSFLKITKHWWTSLDELQFGIMLFIYLVLKNTDWLPIGFVGLMAWSSLYIYDIQHTLAAADMNIKYKSNKNK